MVWEWWKEKVVKSRRELEERKRIELEVLKEEEVAFFWCCRSSFYLLPFFVFVC